MDVEFPRHPLAPGKNGELKIQYRPTGFSGMGVSRVVAVMTNDQVTPRTELVLFGKMAPNLGASPARLNVVDVRVGTAWSR